MGGKGGWGGSADGSTGGDVGGGGAGGVGGSSGAGGTGGDTAPDCGNGVVEASEHCDLVDLAGASCLSLGFDAGTLGCSPDCSFDTTDCSHVVECGDGVREGDEACDGADLGEISCIGEGFDWGEIGCSDACAIDTAHCGMGPAPLSETEPNDDYEAEGLISLVAPAVGRGEVGRPATDSEDVWAIEVEKSGRYRIWTSYDAKGGCDLGEDGTLSLGGSVPFSISEFIRDIDPPSNRCSSITFRTFGTGSLLVGVSSWSPTFTYYLWFEEL